MNPPKAPANARPPPAAAAAPGPPLVPGPEENEQELRLKRTLINALLENIPDFVYFKDLESRFIAVSKSKAARHGCESSSALVGKTDADLFSPVYAKLARREEEEVMRTGAAMLEKEGRILWPDGRITWARSCKLPLRDEEGRIMGTFGITEDITASKATEDALEKTRSDLMKASRLAGMAEVATGVIHNVGNVLNSLNVSIAVVETGLKQSKSASLSRLAALMKEHSGDLSAFITGDPKGKRVPEFLAALAGQLAAERTRIAGEVESLQRNIDHIREIVTMQQSYSTMAGYLEPISPVQLMEDSLRMNTGALLRHEINVVRQFEPAPDVIAERGKVLQILINLIRNAKYALDSCRKDEKILTLQIEATPLGTVRLIVQDNGVGIPPENMGHIFRHGFTTKINGHGFGLHSSVLAAKDMNGRLTAQSDGTGRGATFILELPAAVAARPAEKAVA
ncbi:MAG: ATP-binding protein [Opitutaceae bacterium]|jgi:PAS domain S-box-containing protein